MEGMVDLRIGLAKGFAVIMALVLLCVVIYTVIKLRKQVKQVNNPENRQERSLLKDKFERGEISKEEYETGRTKNLK